MKRFLALTFTALIFLSASHLSAGIFKKENVIGAAIGGLTGGVIGHQSGHRSEGALLGSLAGFAIGSVVHDEKEEPHVEHRYPPAPEPIIIIEETPAPAAAPEPEFTKSEERQLLLQASPLFSVK